MQSNNSQGETFLEAQEDIREKMNKLLTIILQEARRFFRCLKYRVSSEKLNLPLLNDSLSIVWRFRKRNLWANEERIVKLKIRKRGFLIKRQGTFCGVTYHDLKWYSSFVKRYRNIIGRDVRPIRKSLKDDRERP